MTLLEGSPIWWLLSLHCARRADVADARAECPSRRDADCPKDTSGGLQPALAAVPGRSELGLALPRGDQGEKRVRGRDAHF
jgi:hypothetical protein